MSAEKQILRNDKGRVIGEAVFAPWLWPCVMIDIETLATTDDAVILEIGAVCFDRERRLVGEAFSLTLDYLSQPGRRVDMETVAWWLDPERIARFREIQAGHELKPGLWHGMLELEQFLRVQLAPAAEVWAKGDFDLRILKHAFSQMEMEEPWKYYQARELRTVLKWVGLDLKKEKVPHEAVRDARLQVEALFAAEERRIPGGETDPEGGWEVYRTEMAETRAIVVPEWRFLPDEVREAWCAGARAFYRPARRQEILNPERRVS